jgi:predicted amidohydrolase YtcJ
LFVKKMIFQAGASLLAALLGLAASVAAQTATADLVLVNGNVVTMDDARPRAQGIAIADGRILTVGSDAEVRRHVGANTEVIDLKGRLAIPGFIEGHGHFMGLGRAQTILDLTTATSWDDIVAMVGEAAAKAKPGEWIAGWGWHQEKWDRVPTPSVEGNPVHQALSAVSPNSPVYLTHASGHASFANAKALELAGIKRETASPSGGEIVRDPKGDATGLLRETAQGLVGRALGAWEASRTPAEREATMRRQAELAGREALANGVTSFHDAGASFATIDFFKRLADEGALPVRLYVMVRVGSERNESESNDAIDRKLREYRVVGYGNDYLTVRSIKRQIDGALGSHGAWLLEPYEDLPRSTGLNLEPVADIERTAQIAIREGYQLNTHAIGDRANREVLDIYEKVFRAHPDKKDLRWRIEHAQHLHPADIERFGKLGVIASIQGIHATSDGPWVPQKLGDKRTEEGAYVWQKLRNADVVIINGTDVPVEKISPIASYYSTVSRRLPDGQVFYGGERLSREQALKTYTINGAYAAFEEDRKGSLTPGKLADIAVLSQDILTIPEEQIPNTKVDVTIVGGTVKYRREGAATRP